MNNRSEAETLLRKYKNSQFNEGQLIAKKWHVSTIKSILAYENAVQHHNAKLEEDIKKTNENRVSLKRNEFLLYLDKNLPETITLIQQILSHESIPNLDNNINDPRQDLENLSADIAKKTFDHSFFPGICLLIALMIITGVLVILTYSSPGALGVVLGVMGYLLLDVICVGYFVIYSGSYTTLLSKAVKLINDEHKLKTLLSEINDQTLQVAIEKANSLSAKECIYFAQHAKEIKEKPGQSMALEVKLHQSINAFFQPQRLFESAEKSAQRQEIQSAVSLLAAK